MNRKQVDLLIRLIEVSFWIANSSFPLKKWYDEKDQIIISLRASANE